MGAGGSTAASCSSLDVVAAAASQGNNKLNRRHYRAQNNHLLLERKLQKCQQSTGGAGGGNGVKLDKKRQCSNMKQSSSYLDLTSNYLPGPLGWLEASSQPEEAYSLNNANFQSTRPIKVLPSSPAPVCNLKKSNAGVASRIQHQRRLKLLSEHERANELRKFSDSLPSLNNIMANNHQEISHRLPAANGTSGFHWRAANLIGVREPLTGLNQSASTPSASSGKQISSPCCRQQAANNKSQQMPTTTRLVTHDPSSAIQQPSWAAGRQSNQLMKRATSLSSLHNLHNNNNNHHHHHHQQPNFHHPHHNQTANNGSRQPSNSFSSHQAHTGSSSGSGKQQQQLVNPKQGYPRSALSGANCVMEPIGKYRSSPHEQQFHSPKQQQQLISANHHSSEQPSKKLFRYKQNPASQHHNKRYKQPSPPQQQQGCPVLPPLPRSQSLHELVQLRATENGQRMRNTGTLRGPFGQPADKVNLVTELLESRRRKQAVDSQGSTMASQSSSTDDGIHSIKADQSTGDSRRHSNFHLTGATTADDDDDDGKRVFKKNPHTGSQAAYKRSTLKRSASHSALSRPTAGRPSGNLRGSHDSNIDDEDDDELDEDADEDESDDLNELAKFLYQFKRRQAAAAAEESAASKASPVISNKPQDKETLDGKPATSQQQSPSSTTSSSGFASSTCNSNSISSAASDELGGRRDRKPPTSRKKHPAPPRPDAAKCPPISGKLKLSSSLLSIVDEYQSTLQGEPPASSPANLTSVLLGADQSNASYCHQQEQSSNLEQLKRYTQLRQMSQSELALNQLTYSAQQQPQRRPPVANGSKSKRSVCEPTGSSSSSSNTSKPYKSKLINLIRRISDKSEGSDQSNGSRSAGGQHWPTAEKPTVGSSAGEPINQNELIVCQRSNEPAGLVSGPASESVAVCDLNFDCDLELIKRCAAASTGNRNGHNNHRGKPVDLKQASCQSERPKETTKPSSKDRQAVVGSSKADNWRLVSSALLLAKSANTRQQQQASKPSGAQGGKLKWSPSGWLMSRHQGGSSSSSSDGPKSAKQKKPSNKCLAGVAVTSSGTPTQRKEDDVMAAIVNYAKVNSEASQLLDELDQSLDLVSAETTAPFSRKAALSSCLANKDRSLDAPVSRSALDQPDNGCCFDFDTAEEEEEEDYASLNRAMINVTFDADRLAGASHWKAAPAGSPSDSFTFSAPSSPASASKNNAASQANREDGDNRRLMGQNGGQLSKKQNLRTTDDSELMWQQQQRQPLRKCNRSANQQEDISVEPATSDARNGQPAKIEPQQQEEASKRIGRCNSKQPDCCQVANNGRQDGNQTRAAICNEMTAENHGNRLSACKANGSAPKCQTCCSNPQQPKSARQLQRQVNLCCQAARRDLNLKRSISSGCAGNNDTCCPTCCRSDQQQLAVCKPAAGLSSSSSNNNNNNNNNNNSRFINIKQPICRSNSELLAGQQLGKQVADAGKLANQKEQFLFGKLRSSLLSAASKPAGKTTASNKQQLLGKLANGSQLSLANYALGGHFVSPFLGANSRLMAANFNHLASSQSQLSNMDDNFILRRKTPNAGLKSQS